MKITIYYLRKEANGYVVGMVERVGQTKFNNISTTKNLRYIALKTFKHEADAQAFFNRLQNRLEQSCQTLKSTT